MTGAALPVPTVSVNEFRNIKNENIAFEFRFRQTSKQLQQLIERRISLAMGDRSGSAIFQTLYGLRTDTEHIIRRIAGLDKRQNGRNWNGTHDGASEIFSVKWAIRDGWAICEPSAGFDTRTNEGGLASIVKFSL